MILTGLVGGIFLILALFAIGNALSVLMWTLAFPIIIVSRYGMSGVLMLAIFAFAAWTYFPEQIRTMGHVAALALHQLGG